MPRPVEPIAEFTDTDDRSLWVTADHGAIRIDLGVNDEIGGYRLFLTRSDAVNLAESLGEAEIMAWTQQHAGMVPGE